MRPSPRLTAWAHRVDVAATLGALAVVPVLLVEASAGESWLRSAAAWANWAIWLLFVADAGLKVATRGPRWLGTRDGILGSAIIVLSLPALGELAASARLARLARLTRIARVLRFATVVVSSARLVRGIRRLGSPEAVPWLTLGTSAVIVLGGGAFYLVEVEGERSLGDGLWWALTTVTTVGYGDISPATPAGRLVAAVVMIVGIAYTSLLTAGIATALARGDRAEQSQDLAARLDGLAARLEGIEAKITRLASSEDRAGAMTDGSGSD